MRIYEDRRPAPAGIILEDYIEDVEIGLLKTGKEAEVYVIERRAPGRSCLLAEKRYRPPEQRAFRNDIAYRAHRRVDTLRRDGGVKRKASRGRAIQLAMDKRTRFGRAALAGGWIEAEYATLRRLYEAGASVPYPVARTGSGILMQYIGDADGAAPRLSQARAEGSALSGLFEQVRETLHRFGRAGMVHADLSPYNVLLWEERLWFIDLPQAVPYLDNSEAADFLHRDCVNICSWFVRKGLDVDPEEVFADVLGSYFAYQMEDLFLAHRPEVP